MKAETKQRIIWIIVLIAYTALVISFAGCGEAKMNGRIIRVIDGDTFIFWTRNHTIRVRMSDIDAPELSQPFGEQSKEWLSQYLNTSATLKIEGEDKYHRTLGTLFVGPKNINLLSVQQGQSWCYCYNDNYEVYHMAQEHALQYQLGLWAYSEVIRPSDWRKQHRH